MTVKCNVTPETLVQYRTGQSNVMYSTEEAKKTVGHLQHNTCNTSSLENMTVHSDVKYRGTEQQLKMCVYKTCNGTLHDRPL